MPCAIAGVCSFAGVVVLGFHLERQMDAAAVDIDSPVLPPGGEILQN